MKVLVIGGGIIGCLTACFLKKQGADVVVLERGQMGQEASWAGAGILCPIHPWLYPDSFTKLIDASLDLYPKFQQHIEKDTGMVIERYVSGLMIPFFNDDKINHWQAALDWSQRLDWQVDILNQNQSLEHEPALSKAVIKSLLWRDVAQVRNPRLLQAIQAWMQMLGVEIRQQTEVTSLLCKQGKVSGVQCADGVSIEADQVLLAGGSWSGVLAEQLGFSLPVRPVKGQIVLLKGEPNIMHSMVKHDDAYFVPRKDGRILVGASMEFVGFARGNTDEVIDMLLQSMARIMPGLKSLTIEKQWMGFRPGSPDGLPFLGAVEGIEGLWVASGHYRNGVALAPITAQVMSDWMMGKKPKLDMQDFSPSRHIAANTALGFPQK